MFDVFGSIRGLLKIDTVCIDNNIFRLHYKATVAILIAFSLIVTSRQYIGDPIDCIVGDAVPSHVMDTYCWIYSTFTMTKDGNAAHPGVGPESHSGDRKYHKYYQWVCFVLFFQAMFFYLPRYLWKIWEGGRIKMLMLDLDRPIISEQCKADQKKLLVDYFVNNMHTQNFYALRFFFCEFLNFVNVVVQIFFMDQFLEGEFRLYGLDVFKFILTDPDKRVDPMARVFPKVTKCSFNRYGPSGSLHTIDGLCLLPLNIVNEKVYVFLWFWFLLIAILSALHLVYRITVVTIPGFRLLLFRTRSRLAHRNEIQIIFTKCQIGDWFVLYQLSKNIDPLIFKEFLSDLAQKLNDIEIGRCEAISLETLI